MTISSKLKVRADHVGSLLRPAALKAMRAQHIPAGELHASPVVSPELAEIEDASVREAVDMQEDVGLQIVTDGEFRRTFWHYDFLDGLDGMNVVERPEAKGVQFKGTSIRPFFPTITDTIDFPVDHPMLDHYRFLSGVSGVAAKISIPGPSTCHFRTAAADIGPAKYAETEVLLADVAAAYRKAIQAFYDAGCRYLQLDDIFFAYLCDEDQRERKRAEGFDPDSLIAMYADTLESAIADRPDDMTIAMHMCRGNFRSTWVAQGGYDPAVDAIFNRTSVDVYFMEYDTERAGGLEPLRLLPEGDKRIMAGFITTKMADLEAVDDLERRFEQASKFVPIDQLGIAPQCGFASTEEGNEVTATEQRAKLELVVKTAERIWGGVSS